MSRTLFIMVTAMMLLVFNSGLATASADLMVGPGTIKASPAIHPGQTVKLPTHEITNNSFRALEMTVSVSDRADDERLLPPAEWFSITPDELIVQARSSAEVQVELVLPDDAPPGEYKVWFLFDSMPIGSQGGLVTAAAINVSFTFDVAEVKHSLTTQIKGQGEMEPSVGEHEYPRGTVVEVRAIPSQGWEFAGWEGTVAHPDRFETTLTMDQDRTLVALFSELQPEPIPTPSEPDDESEADEKVGEEQPDREREEPGSASEVDDGGEAAEPDSDAQSIPYAGALIVAIAGVSGFVLHRRLRKR